MQDLPPADIVIELLEGFRRSKAMFAALSLGVFKSLAGRSQTATELASSLRLNEDALGRLLDYCVALQLLERDGAAFRNAPVAGTYLLPDSPQRLTGYVGYANEVLWKMWANLEDAIRDGTNRWQQTFGGQGALFDHFFRTDERRREFLLGMHGFGQLSSPHVATAFDLSRFRLLVDLGGATGHLAVAACRRYPQLRAIVFDLPVAVPLAQEMIGKTEVADRVTIHAGDFFHDSLPEGDLFTLGRILHDWTEEKIVQLLRRIHERLPVGGALLVAEKLLDDDRSGPAGSLSQSLNMLVVTEGKERTLAEYAALLSHAGFTAVESRRTPSPLDAVMGWKQ